MSFCTNCGQQLQPNWNLCPNCGQLRVYQVSQVQHTKPFSPIVEDYSRQARGLGILGLLLFLIPIVAIPFCILAIYYSSKSDGDTGLVLGILGLFINAFSIIFIIYFIIDIPF